MRYEIVRLDLHPAKMMPRLRFYAESEEEKKKLIAIESELDSQFGRGNYHLQFCCIGGSEGGFKLEYLVLPSEVRIKTNNGSKNKK